MVHHRGKDVVIPTGENDHGKYTAQLKGWMRDIMYGNEQHPWGVIVNERE